jgi:DHA2 family methylenomycin A resistance protein-like MFS transporter
VPLAIVVLAQVLNVASATVVAVALPALARDLGADATEQQWVVDAFVLVFASLLIAGGVLADRYGRRLALVVGLGLFAAGSLWCLLAPTVEWLIAGRVLQALGSPLTLPASLAIVTGLYPDRAERARAIGIWGAGSGTGLALGPLLGGGIVDLLGWRWVFGVNVPICALLLVAALRYVPRDRPERPEVRPDAVAALLLIAGVALLVFGVIESHERGWGSPEVLGSFAGGVLALAGFAHRERRHPAPLVDLHLLRHPAFAGANAGAAILYAAITGAAVYISVFLQEVQGRSAFEAGLVLLPQGALTALCAPVAGRLMARVGARVPIIGGMVAMCAGFLVLAGLDRGTTLAEEWLGFGLIGIGTGLALPPMTTVVVSVVEVGKAGMASAIHNASRQMGQTFGIAILGTIVFARAGGETASDGYVDGLRLALLVSAAAIGLTVAGMAVMLRRRAVS